MENETLQTKKFVVFIIITVILCLIVILATGCTSTSPEQRCRDAGLSIQKMTIEETQGMQNSRVECLKPKNIR